MSVIDPRVSAYLEKEKTKVRPGFMCIAPTPEFLEAYRRVTGSTDFRPGAVIRAVRSPLVDEIRRIHAEIMWGDCN